MKNNENYIGICKFEGNIVNKDTRKTTKMELKTKIYVNNNNMDEYIIKVNIFVAKLQVNPIY